MIDIDELTLYFKKIHDIFVTEANLRLRSFDLTFSQMGMFFYLYERKDVGTTLKDIEFHFNLKHPTVIGIIQRMEKKGLIRRIPNPENHRGKHILLTEKAIQVEQELLANKKKLNNKILNNLTERQLEELYGLLDLIYRNLKEN